ncbi:mechanosensitive ion channel family protein [Chlorogloeopsis sp. ULAP01]|uniref:mechanosensitive ion channel family protein n=1 Tax=Chlorogloeopsis sp. ULAP01 TaxID=3056483 RepID=UPI0025AA4169|nr:mechanosensitive ion channel family protein [Chlorogloeopsis sp. ULAP01]MDM9383250.1 mechanosensitive ion channel family protein [Chlorogloeopsis sp. ULAP01]
MPKATAQFPFFPNLQPPTLRPADPEGRIVTGWVYLDGRRLFQVSAPRTNFTERLESIQSNLYRATQNYLDSPSQEVNVDIEPNNGLPIITVNNQYLMTVTAQDANLRQVDPLTAANQISEILKEDLKQARQERRTDFLLSQGAIASATGLGVIVISWGLYQWRQRSKRHSLQQASPTSSAAKPITSQLNQQHHRHLEEVKRRLHQLAQTMLWGGSTFFILGLFPYTRSLQLGIFIGLQIPIKLAGVGIGTYVAIRLSYALIDRFTSAFVSSSALLTPESSERLQLRVSTISGVTKGIVGIAFLGVGTLFALISLGIDIVPLLAGAGLVGVAISLASQSLIKDAINGFLIILEDQYALGDVINVGNVGGLVENLNLRMTQVRDSEGRLITIPNSEIKIVANLSSRWSRADLTIPVAYEADIDEALQLIKTVALEMDQDPQWQLPIVETPQVLGIDNFGDRGLLIRVWIKTQPLKQWDVAREFRRRLKIAFDKAGIAIPVPQQAVWVNDVHLLKSQADGKTN